MADTVAAVYRVAFRASDECAGVLGTFRFDKPAGFSFVAGQYLTLTLPTREGEQSKPFTVSAGPGDPYLEITTRLSGSAFKDALQSLVPGDMVRVGGPHGRLGVPDGVAKVVFLVGGVGATPAHSIIRDAIQRSTGLRIAMFYGNRDLTCVPFKEEFDSYESTHPEIKIVDVLMEPPEGWAGERGFITSDLVRRYVEALDEWHFIVAGPPAMIDPMKQVLAELAIPQERASLEVFTGYE